MSLHVTLPVFQRKDGLDLSMFTVGLGPYNLSHSGRSAVKLQRKIVNLLRKLIAELPPGELARFHLRHGTQLERVRLEMTLGGDVGRRRVSGWVPIVLEPRWLSDDEHILIAYHPLRQDEWFPLPDADALPERAPAFFRHAWAEVDEIDLAALMSRPKDQLKSFSFVAQTKSLLARLDDAEREDERRRAGQGEREKVLDALGVHETLRAIEATLPAGMPREPYRAELRRLLGGVGVSKRSTLVVGPPGVGKTTLIHQWIADQLSDDGFEVHRNLDRIHNVWSLSGKRLIAGMSMLGDWEKRCIDLLHDCRAQRAMLVIDDLHLFGRLGQTRDSERNLAGFFRGPVARGELVICGECTPLELERLEDDAPAFASLFARVHVRSTDTAETTRMMMHRARQLEQRHGCSFHPFTYRAVLELGGSLFSWRALPGKALDLLRQLADSASADATARAASDAADTRAGRAAPTEITPADVIALLSRTTGLPAHLLSLEERLDTAAIAAAFAQRVMGQTAAGEAAADIVFRVRAGLTDPARPLAVCLFTGPTGTGKTEMAKAITEAVFGDIHRLLRFDMSEYSSPDAVARLIGDRFRPSGQLTERVREQPFSLVLFDEIEKAHPQVLGLLLQLFDEGRLSDAAGNAVSFTSAVVLMTSNLGAKTARPIGFGDKDDRVLAEIDRAVRDFFPPELWNRIDRVVPFRPLTAAVAAAVADKELGRLLGRRGLEDRHIFVYANDAVKDRIVAEAFDPAHGARTVKRYLEDHIGSLLAEEIAAGPPVAMRVVRLYDSGGAFRLHTEPLTEIAPADAEFALAPLVDLPALRLREHLPAAAAVLADVRLPDILEQTRAAIDAGDVPGDILYYLDVYQRRVEDLGEWLAAHGVTVASWEERGQKRPPVAAATKDELLAHIAEAYLLRRAATTLADPAEHVVWLDVLAVGHAQKGPGAAAPPVHGDFIHRLIAHYARPAWIEGWALRYADGRVLYNHGGPEVAAALLTSLPERGRRPVRQAVIELAGLSARDAFAGEDGCHIWQSFGAEPEIVRVKVSAGPGAGRPRDVVTQHLARVRAFEEALERGDDPLPENPESLAPAVRAFHDRPAALSGHVFPIDIEDFYLGYAATMNVRDANEVLGRLALLRASRAPSADVRPPDKANVRPPDDANVRPPDNANVRPPDNANVRPPDKAPQ